MFVTAAVVRSAIRCSVTILLLAASAWPQQAMSRLDRDNAEGMLRIVTAEVRKHYYDPKFHGVDWDATIAEARQKIDKATSLNMALSHIAATLDALNDSHTFFLPPQRSYRHDYGFRYQMVGQRCIVTRVRPGSDAESKGVRPGDQVLAINGYNVDRNDLWKVQYVFSVLRPQPGLRLDMQDPAGNTLQVDIATKFHEGKRVADLTGENGASDIWDIVRQEETSEHLARARYAEYGDQLLILKVPEFFFSPIEVGDMIGRARKHQALIVDLRGNPGGSTETLKLLVGGMFDHEVKIADRVGRREAKPEIAKALHDPFKGKLIVLVDGESASAAELFARIMQIEKRGMVLGDVTSGSVMEARHYDEQMGTDTVVFYGASVTEWDLIMTDGKSLEHSGVIPDQLLLPNDQAIAHGRDPLLGRAAEMLGVKLSSEEAGKLFPYEWPPE